MGVAPGGCLRRTPIVILLLAVRQAGPAGGDTPRVHSRAPRRSPRSSHAGQPPPATPVSTPAGDHWLRFPTPDPPTSPKAAFTVTAVATAVAAGSTPAPRRHRVGTASAPR